MCLKEIHQIRGLLEEDFILWRVFVNMLSLRLQDGDYIVFDLEALQIIVLSLVHAIILSDSVNVALNVKVVALLSKIQRFLLGMNVIDQAQEAVMVLVETVVCVDLHHLLEEEDCVFD